MARDWGQRFTVREGRFGRILVIALTLLFLALAAAIGAVAWINARTAAHTETLIHTYQVEIAIGDVRQVVEQIETTRRGYMLSPATAGFRTGYRDATRALPGVLGKLHRLTADNPAQRRSLTDLVGELDSLTALREESVRLIERGAVGEAIARFDRELAAARMRSIREVLERMRAEEQRLLAIRDAEQNASIRAFYVVLAITGALLVLVVVVTLLVVLRYTRDLGRSRDSLRGLNENLETIVADRTADLSRANDEIQRFAYIVSHDLRSPLVNVMGFTAELEAASGHLRALIDRAEEQAPDLLDDESRLAAREDLPEAIGFIRTSTQRMDRLINAILTLSRQGRRVLTPEPIDLAAIVAAIRDTLAHRLDEQGASVEIEGSLPAIVSDRLAIEQILQNLIENAVKYRHPDRPVRVTVSGAREGARMWIDVADNGRGIDPRDHERVFDLFRRSGTQDQPGEGIGLAHVRALAYRLGGTIALRSVLGEGATFRLSLPTKLDLRGQSE